MPKRLGFVVEKCTGCHQCELSCSGMNEGMFSPERSRIRIFLLPNRSLNIPYACFQCEEAWCMHACPVQAIRLNPETGAKVLDQSACVGCKVCTISCPYGTVVYQPASGNVVKCDLCDGDEDGPACVASCPTSAITYEEVSV